MTRGEKIEKSRLKGVSRETLTSRRSRGSKRWVHQTKRVGKMDGKATGASRSWWWWWGGGGEGTMEI